MSYLVARGLRSSPFVEIYEIENEVPVRTFFLEPPIAGPVEKLKFPRNNSQMAIATKFRREFVEGIGHPDEVVPSAGLRLIAPNDSYILFGGTSSIAPVFYQRRGPSYGRWAIDIPSGAYVITAAFAASSRHLFAVTSDAPDMVKVFRRAMSGFELIHSISAGFSVVDLTIPTGDIYVVILGATEFSVHELLDSQVTPFPLVSPTPSGALKAISPDNRWYIVETNNTVDDLEIYRHDAGAWTKQADLVDSNGGGTRVSFAPDGVVMELSSSARGTNFYSVSNGNFFLTGNVNQGVNNPRRIAYSHDSVYAVLSNTSETAFMQRAELPVGKWFTDPDLVDDDFDDVISKPKFSADGSRMVVATSTAPYVRLYDRVDGQFVPVVQTFDTGFSGTATDACLSPNGQTLVIGHTGAPYFSAYRWGGTQWEKMTTPALPAQTGYTLVGQPVNVIFSPDGVYFAVSAWYRNNSTNVTRTFGGIYRYVGDPGTISLSVDCYGGTMAFSPDGVYLICSQIVEGGGGSRRTYQRGSGQFVTITTGSDPVTAMSFSDDSQLLFAVRAGTLRVMARPSSGQPWVEVIGGATVPSAVDVAAVGADRIAVLTSTFPYLRDIQVNSPTSFVEGAATLFPPTVRNQIARVPASQKLVLNRTTGSPYVEAYELLDPIPEEYRRFTYSKYAARAIPSLDIDGFDPNGLTVHIGNRHIDVTAPGVDLETLAFDDEYAANQISDVLWSRSGNFVLYSNPDGQSVTVKLPGDDGYRMAKNLNGLFIAKYVREDDTLRETEYVVHDVDAEITNLVYSDTGLGFSYFLLDDPAKSGRLIYDTDGEKLDLKGIDYDARMEASFLAFSPHETHFVVTYQMSDTAHELRLFSLGTNRAFTYEDTELVDFGPVDISPCDDVLVAHGGETSPFSMFSITDWEFFSETFPLVDWEYGGFVWDIVFTDDCKGLYVLTPNEIVVVDLEEGEVTDELPLDNPPTDSEGGNLDKVDDGGEGDTVIRNPDPDGTGGGGGAGGGGGTWRPIGGGSGGGPNERPGLDSITYQRYSTAHVTYRR